ncbi:MAG: PrgI family protein [Candidatus Pacebacteria bacterium]|nr:PrgI family protein [Candidatus Paceibacterota bacterium]
MEYQVPQFIEVEDKIFGPLTFKQFLYLAGGAGLAAGLVLYLPLVLGVMFALPIAGLAVGLAFYKLNGKPLIDLIEAGLSFYVSRRLYLWKKEPKVAEALPTVSLSSTLGEDAPRQKLDLTTSRLKELALSLDSRVNLEENHA